MRILLVEDEKRIQDFLSRGLESEGYAVDVAPDGGQLGGSSGDLGFDVQGHQRDSNRKDVITRRNSPPCTLGKKCPPSGST